jgi:nitrate reductase NapE component
MNHVLHLLISVLLCGFWIPIWLLAMAANASEPYRCNQCGGKASGSGARALVAFAIVVLVVWIIAAKAFVGNMGSSKRTPGVTDDPAKIQAPTSAEPLTVKPEKTEAEVLAEQVRAQRAAAEEKKKELAANALKYHQRLADKGDPYGEYQMGLRYMNGDEVEKDWFKAADYLGKAAVQGRTDAAAELNKLLASRRSQTN